MTARVTSMREHRAPSQVPPRVAQQQTTQIAPRSSALRTIGIGIAISVVSAALIAIGVRVLRMDK